MIDGFKLKIPAAELREHLSKRSAHHRQRATEKEKELPGIRDSIEKIKPDQEPQDIGGKNVTSGYSAATSLRNTLATLESEVRDHRGKALAFDFFAAHLFDEDYDMGESDLYRLEILKR